MTRSLFEKVFSDQEDEKLLSFQSDIDGFEKACIDLFDKDN